MRSSSCQREHHVLAAFKRQSGVLKPASYSTSLCGVTKLEGSQWNPPGPWTQARRFERRTCVLGALDPGASEEPYDCPTLCDRHGERLAALCSLPSRKRSVSKTSWLVSVLESKATPSHIPPCRRAGLGVDFDDTVHDDTVHRILGGLGSRHRRSWQFWRSWWQGSVEGASATMNKHRQPSCRTCAMALKHASGVSMPLCSVRRTPSSGARQGVAAAAIIGDLLLPPLNWWALRSSKGCAVTVACRSPIMIETQERDQKLGSEVFLRR